MTKLGYARVSTGEQDPEYQVRALTDAGCEKVWVETASGYRDRRPELDSLLEYARAGDAVVIWRLDRLGRSVQHLLLLSKQLDERQIDLTSLNDSIDTTTAAGRFTFTLLAAVAELEGNLRRERQEAAWAAGKQKGRPTVVTPEQLVLARKLREDGHSYREIAELIGRGKTVVFRALNPREVA
jgi:DNA invertase Pin-like site-specific DNA recombinase